MISTLETCSRMRPCRALPAFASAKMMARHRITCRAGRWTSQIRMCLANGMVVTVSAAPKRAEQTSRQIAERFCVTMQAAGGILAETLRSQFARLRLGLRGSVRSGDCRAGALINSPAPGYLELLATYLGLGCVYLTRYSASPLLPLRHEIFLTKRHD